MKRTKVKVRFSLGISVDLESDDAEIISKISMVKMGEAVKSAIEDVAYDAATINDYIQESLPEDVECLGWLTHDITVVAYGKAGGV